MDKIAAIAINTFRESVRSKVLYSFFFFALFLVLLSSIFSATTLGDRMKLLRDFGLAVTSLGCVLFVVVAGSTLLAKELHRKTVFNILAKPVHRYQFIVGKFFGLYLTSLTLLALMGAGLMALLYLFEGALDLTLLEAYAGIACELLIVAGCVLFFSAIVVTPMLTGLFSFCAFLAGRSVGYLAAFAQDPDMPAVLRSISGTLHTILPRLDRLYIANDIVYGSPVSGTYLVSAFLYSASYAALLLVLGSFLFTRREFR